jgi:hypothetical protein
MNPRRCPNCGNLMPEVNEQDSKEVRIPEGATLFGFPIVEVCEKCLPPKLKGIVFGPPLSWPEESQ